MCAIVRTFWAARSTGPTPSPDPASSPATRMRHRADAMTSQVAAANRVLRHYRVNLADWQGTALRRLDRNEGKTEIVDNLGHLWTAVERLIGKPCDPLDAELITAMERIC